MNGPSRAQAWLILAAIAGGVLLFQLVERSKGFTERAKAERLGSELLAAESPEQAAAIARELGALDDSAIRPLVQALVSEEPLVSAAAWEEINRRLAAWRELSRKASGTKVAALARELAEWRESIPLEHQRGVRRWAEAILFWPLKGSQADAGAVMADCEAILELPEPDQQLLTERLALLAQKQSQPPEEESPVVVELPPEESQATESSNLPPIVSARDVASPPTNSGTITDDEPAESPPIPPYPREPRGIYVPRARPIEDAAPPAEPPKLNPSEPTLMPPVKASAESSDLASVPEIEVMYDLQSEDAATVAAAESELTRRGYKKSQLSLARQLTSADPAVRLKLVKSLPQARGIDPRPWLLRLSEDSDEGVRTAALSILRTSQDEDLLQKLR